jgi:hypothetical protein
MVRSKTGFLLALRIHVEIELGCDIAKLQIYIYIYIYFVQDLRIEAFSVLGRLKRFVCM